MKLILSLLLCALPVMAGPQKPAAKPAPTPAPAAKPTGAATPAAPPAAAATATAPASSKDSELDPAVRTRIEAFFKSLQAHRVKDGFEGLYEGSTIAAEQPVLMDTVTRNTLLVIEKCGKVESASILRVRSAGPTLKQVTCILNCQKRPMLWTVFVYFAEGRWQVLDNNVELELHSFFDPEGPAAN